MYTLIYIILSCVAPTLLVWWHYSWVSALIFGLTSYGIMDCLLGIIETQQRLSQAMYALQSPPPPPSPDESEIWMMARSVEDIETGVKALREEVATLLRHRV